MVPSALYKNNLTVSSWHPIHFLHLSRLCCLQSFTMIPILFSATLSLLSFSLGVDARSTPAIPAIQHLSPRAIYQGGWPLALAGSASTTCPSDTPVLCDSKLVNPACCPAGQTCIFGGGQDANYCCPTGMYYYFVPTKITRKHKNNTDRMQQGRTATRQW